MVTTIRKSPARDRIFAAAEILVADHGFDGFSVRMLAAKARVNLAAINYYFGSKDGLCREIVDRRIRPINGELLSRLTRASTAVGDRPLPLDEIVAILIGPALDTHRDPEKGGAAAARILARCMADPPSIGPELAGELQSTLARFAQALRRHAPKPSPEEFLWRFTFVVGAMQHTLASLHQISALTRGICRSDDHEGVARRFVNFATAVLTAPPN